MVEQEHGYVKHGDASAKPVGRVRQPPVLHFAVLFVQALAEGFDFLFGRINSREDNHHQHGQLDAGDGMIGSDGDADGGKYPSLDS